MTACESKHVTDCWSTAI